MLPQKVLEIIYYIYCPVLQLTTTGTRCSQQSNSDNTHVASYCCCNIVATNHAVNALDPTSLYEIVH